MKNAPNSVKKQLLARSKPDGPFLERADILLYVHPRSRKWVQVDFMSDEMVSQNTSLKLRMSVADIVGTFPTGTASREYSRETTFTTSGYSSLVE